MSDSSWDNSGHPTPKKGMSVLAMVGLGCGVIFLLVALTCGSCIWWGSRQFTSSLDKSWAKMRVTVESLRTEEGTAALYRNNPGLKENYSTEDEFRKAVREWRPKLGDIPAVRPEILKLVKENGLEVRVGKQSGVETIHFRYQLANGARLQMDTEGDKLTDIRVE